MCRIARVHDTGTKKIHTYIFLNDFLLNSREGIGQWCNVAKVALPEADTEMHLKE